MIVGDNEWSLYKVMPYFLYRFSIYILKVIKQWCKLEIKWSPPAPLISRSVQLSFECCLRVDGFDSCSVCLWSVWSVLCFSSLHSPHSFTSTCLSCLSLFFCLSAANVHLFWQPWNKMPDHFLSFCIFFYQRFVSNVI